MDANRLEFINLLENSITVAWKAADYCLTLLAASHLSASEDIEIFFTDHAQWSKYITDISKVYYLNAKLMRNTYIYQENTKQGAFDKTAVIADVNSIQNQLNSMQELDSVLFTMQSVEELLAQDGIGMYILRAKWLLRTQDLRKMPETTEILDNLHKEICELEGKLNAKGDEFREDEAEQNVLNTIDFLILASMFDLRRVENPDYIIDDDDIHLAKLTQKDNLVIDMLDDVFDQTTNKTILDVPNVSSNDSSMYYY